MSIHPLAAVSPEARLGVGVTVGAFATVEDGLEGQGGLEPGATEDAG